ncbi:MAG: PKD domain-containing protein, partial [Bacteroidales bacterium]
MKRIITISAVLALILTGCNKDPVSNFAYSPASPNTGQNILFENLSLDAESYEWNFGDGNVTSVSDPVHTYMEGGSYTILLKAFGKRGGMDISTATINVISVEPVASFGIYTDLPGDDGPFAFETDIVFVGEQVEF